MFNIKSVLLWVETRLFQKEIPKDRAALFFVPKACVYNTNFKKQQAQGSFVTSLLSCPLKD